MRAALLLAVPFISLLVWFFFDRTPQRTLWFDELATWELASLPSFSDRVAALQNAADSMPPLYYELVNWAMALPLPVETSLRIPSLVGLLLAAIGLGWFLWRTTSSSSAALIGVSVLSTTVLLGHGLDARPYALWTGLLAMALALFAEAIHRGTTFWWIAASLALALCFSVHYFAIFAWPSFALLVLLASDGRYRKPSIAWWALGLPLGVGVLHYPLIRAFQQTYGKTFWAKATWAEVSNSYSDLLGLSSLGKELAGHRVEIAVIAVVCLLALFFTPSQTYKTGRNLWLAAFWLLGSPIWLYVIASVTQGAMTPRYSMPLLVGVGVVVGLIAEKLPNRLAIVVASLLFASATTRLHHAGFFGFNDTQSQPIRGLPFAAELGEHPEYLVAIAGSLDFLPFHYYASESLRPKITYIQEPVLAKNLTGVDTIELLLERLPAKQPRYLTSLAQLRQVGRPFYLVFRPGYGEWIPYQLEREGWKLTVVRKHLVWAIARAER